MNKSLFGFQLAYCRKEENISQEKLAEILECSPCTISRIENGKEYPRVELFERINGLFGHWGVNGPDIYMDDSAVLQKAQYELLTAIHEGQAEVIYRKLEAFIKLMDEENEEHQQYYSMGHLAYMRRKGMDLHEYKEKCVMVFEKRRKMPNTEDVASLKLSRIEHMILFKYAMALFEMGLADEAEKLLMSLMKNCFIFTSEYNKKRCKTISTCIAKVFLHKNDYKKAQECIGYVIGRILENLDSRMIFQILGLQQKLFESCNDPTGMKIIDDFLMSACKMINYLHRHLAVEKHI